MTYTHAFHICTTCIEWIEANAPANVPASTRMNLCFVMACFGGLTYAVAEDIGAWPGPGPMPPLRVFFPAGPFEVAVATLDIQLYDNTEKA